MVKACAATAAISSKTKLRTHILFSAVGCLLYLGWIISMPAVSTLATVSATSERIEFTVINPDLAAIPISGMRLALPDATPACLKGVLRPHLGAVVAYERGLNDDLAIVLVEGRSEFRSAIEGVPSQEFKGPFEIVTGENCGAPPSRLPIWGQLRIGEEMPPTSGRGTVQLGLLLEGKLRVQARAIERRLLLSSQPTLYPVVEMDLPVGARVEAAETREELRNWWGTAYVDKDKVALQVLAATEASRLAIFRPNRTDADVIQVTALTQLFSDPNVVRTQIIVLGFAAIIQFVAAQVVLRS